MMVEPPVALHVGEGLTLALIAEERKNLVFPDRSADAAAELFELTVVSCDGKTSAVEALICVQVRLVGGEKATSMEVVRATLRNDLQLGAGEAAILGIIAIGDDFNAINGILRRSDDG